MPIYQGKAFKQFLIDRYAMGFQPAAICQDFEVQQGVPITEAEVEGILKGCEPEIRQREDELLTELRSQNVVGALLSIKQELAEVAALAKADKDYKTFAQLANSSMKSLEVLIGMTEKFRQHENTQKKLTTQNNILVLQLLERDGALKIIDIEKTKSLLGVQDSGINDK